MSKSKNGKPQQKSMSVTIDGDLVDWVTQQCKALGVSRNQYMAELIFMQKGLFQLGYFYMRDRRLGFDTAGRQGQPNEEGLTGLHLERATDAAD